MDKTINDKPKKPAAPKKPHTAAASPAAEPARAKFARALEEAKAGAQTLGKEAQAQASAYREKVAGAGSEWIDEAKLKGSQAKDRAWELANEGKARTSEAISGLGKIVEDNAAAIDEKVGARYGGYARTAARTMHDAAARIDATDLSELGEEAKEFVRKSPGLAIGVAAVAGFILARLFKRSDD